MRTISPVKPTNKTDQDIGSKMPRELLLNIVIPLKLVKERFFFSFIIGKDLTYEDNETSASPGEHTLNLIYLTLIILSVLILLFSGIFFLFYLLKSTWGFNIFENFHLFKRQ